MCRGCAGFPFALTLAIIPDSSVVDTAPRMVSSLRREEFVLPWVYSCPGTWWELSADPFSPLAVPQGESCPPLQLLYSSWSSLGHSWVRGPHLTPSLGIRWGETGVSFMRICVCWSAKYKLGPGYKLKSKAHEKTFVDIPAFLQVHGFSGVWVFPWWACSYQLEYLIPLVQKMLLYSNSFWRETFDSFWRVSLVSALSFKLEKSSSWKAAPLCCRYCLTLKLNPHLQTINASFQQDKCCLYLH